MKQLSTLDQLTVVNIDLTVINIDVTVINTDVTVINIDVTVINTDVTVSNIDASLILSYNSSSKIPPVRAHFKVSRSA